MGSAYFNVMVLWLVIAGLWLLAFVVSFLIDRRRLRNGVYLVMALGFGAFGGVMGLAMVSKPAAVIPFLAVLVLTPLSIVALAVFLIANGVTMIRREGRSLGNLLSLLVGLGIVGFLVMVFTALDSGHTVLLAVVVSVTAVLGYVSFVFCCFLLYSILYGRIRHRRDVDFVVVLGSGLFGAKVPPLLAGRLDRGRSVFNAVTARGGAPMMVASGGQGADEEVSEARAMADYLIDHGVPADRVLLEDRSTTTFENLTFSRVLMADHKPDYRCVVVTSNYHVLRAALTTRRAKVNGQVIGSRTALYFWPSAIIREFVAILMEHRVKNLVLCLALALLGPLTLAVSSIE